MISANGNDKERIIHSIFSLNVHLETSNFCSPLNIMLIATSTSALFEEVVKGQGKFYTKAPNNCWIMSLYDM